MNASEKHMNKYHRFNVNYPRLSGYIGASLLSLASMVYGAFFPLGIIMALVWLVVIFLSSRHLCYVVMDNRMHCE